MEKNWNDYDYDNSWDWNDSSYEDTANYIGGINKSHLTIGHIRQAKSLLHKAQIQIATWQENNTHNIMERPQQELSTIPQRRHHTATLRHSSSNTTTKEQEDCGHHHTLHHVLQLQVIPSPAGRLRSIYTCLPEGLRARSTTADLVENQFHNSTRLPTRRFLSTASSMFPTSRTTSGS